MERYLIGSKLPAKLPLGNKHFFGHVVGVVIIVAVVASLFNASRDLIKASTLCDEILSKVILDNLDVTVQQYVVRGEDDFEIQWSLEYRPIGFWHIYPQDQGVYVAKSPKWTEKRVRTLLREAFDKTIVVCRTCHKSEKDTPLQGKKSSK